MNRSLRPAALSLSAMLFVAPLTVGQTAKRADSYVSLPGAASKLRVHRQPSKLPPMSFKALDGQDHSIDSLNGRFVVLNLWATWCAPCVKEMPSLERLQHKAGDRFAVIAISQDAAGTKKVVDFISKLGIATLPIWLDESGRSGRQLRAFALPTTIILDQSGRELARLVGTAQWDHPDTQRAIESIIGPHSAP